MHSCVGICRWWKFSYTAVTNRFVTFNLLTSDTAEKIRLRSSWFLTLTPDRCFCMQGTSFYGWSSENMWHFSWNWADHLIKFGSWYSCTVCLYSTDVCKATTWVCRLKTVDYLRYIRYRRRFGIWISFPFQGFFLSCRPFGVVDKYCVSGSIPLLYKMKTDEYSKLLVWW